MTDFRDFCSKHVKWLEVTAGLKKLQKNIFKLEILSKNVVFDLFAWCQFDNIGFKSKLTADIHQNMHTACFFLANDARVLTTVFFVTQVRFYTHLSLAVLKIQNPVHTSYDETDASTDLLISH